MAKAPPAFQFYPNDFVSGTRKMTTTEVGGYILLLCAQWDDGCVPGDDLGALALIMRCSKATAKSIWSHVAEKFSRYDDGCWRNERLEAVRHEQQAYRDAKSRGGKASAATRQQKRNRTSTQLATQRQHNSNRASTEGATDGQRNVNPPISDLQSSKIGDPELKNNSGSPSHPVKVFLTEHERLFVAHYGEKPAKYTGKDAKIAKSLLGIGMVRAVALLQQFFVSTDPFIAKSGHGLNVFASVQNKLIAELSGRAPVGDGRDWAREFVNG